ncbi:MAG: hypothetical protein GY710_12960 [Desulfobacteraceae bacterium]|nr:hypothetical protein [Desulfobacteraceae bacterium]
MLKMNDVTLRICNKYIFTGSLEKNITGKGARAFRSFSPNLLSGSEVNGALSRPWDTLPFKSTTNPASFYL